MQKSNYYQVTGRPHSGLQDPEKFGLTYEQVVELIDKGEWPAFLKRWKRKQAHIERIKANKRKPRVVNPIVRIRRENKFKCACCKKKFLKTVEHVVLKETTFLCKPCVEFLENHVDRNQDNGENSKASEG